MSNEHKKKTIEFYSNDYKNIAMSEDDIKEMLEGFVESLECDHQCTSDCRKKGCNCDCGEFHF